MLFVTSISFSSLIAEDGTLSIPDSLGTILREIPDEQLQEEVREDAAQLRIAAGILCQSTAPAVDSSGGGGGVASPVVNVATRGVGNDSGEGNGTDNEMSVPSLNTDDEQNINNFLGKYNT